MRIMLELKQAHHSFIYLDSLNAALVAGLVAAGARSEDLVGPASKPWTFGYEGRSDPRARTRLFSVTVSTPDPALGEALARLNPAEVRCVSSNGDALDLSGAVRREIDTTDARNAELMVAFASPFAILRKKDGRSKSEFAQSLDEVDLEPALRRGLERRAGRDLELSFHIDPLTRMTDVRKRVIPLRHSPKGPIRIPAFSAPMTIRGRPKDVEFAFLAGLGAKTHAGLGCPVFMK